MEIVPKHSDCLTWNIKALFLVCSNFVITNKKDVYPKIVQCILCNFFHPDTRVLAIEYIKKFKDIGIDIFTSDCKEIDFSMSNNQFYIDTPHLGMIKDAGLVDDMLWFYTLFYVAFNKCNRTCQNSIITQIVKTIETVIVWCCINGGNPDTRFNGRSARDIISNTNDIDGIVTSIFSPVDGEMVAFADECRRTGMYANPQTPVLLEDVASIPDKNRVYLPFKDHDGKYAGCHVFTRQEVEMLFENNMLGNPLTNCKFTQQEIRYLMRQ
jgi:hypothetical protein